MASRRPIFGLVLGVMALATMAPTFAMPKPKVTGYVKVTDDMVPLVQEAKTVSGRFEIFVTNPSTGMRTRMLVSPTETCDELISRGRKELGFDQAWIKDSDWNIYFADDESTPLKGTVADNNMKPWGPEGTELHLLFQP